MQVKETLWNLGKELSIAPALEIAFRFKSSAHTTVVCDELLPLLLAENVLVLGNKESMLLFSYDKEQTGRKGAMSAGLLAELMLLLKSACARKIRRKQTIMKVFTEECLTDNYIDNFSFSLSQNNFPDQGCIILLELSSSRDDAWIHLQRVRDNIIKELGMYISWATLGYKFIRNPFMRQSSESMMSACMRYLGADLHDVLSVHNAWWWNNLRTINWQTSFNHSDPIRHGWDTAPDIVHYQTGAHPSICDRNDMSAENMASIREYQAHAKELSRSILTPENINWDDKWTGDFFERWANRWSEIKY